MKSLGFIIIFLILFNFSNAQKISITKNLDELVEKLFQIQEIPMNYEDFYESMYQFYNHPIDLNTVTREELQSLYLLSPLQINKFFQHRAKIGLFLSVYELQTIPEFDFNMIQQLLPFVTIKETKKIKDLLITNTSEPKTYMLYRLNQTIQPSRGYLENKYMGSPQQMYLRFRTSQTKSYSLGFTVEKDAGEVIWLKNHGPDFFSFHAAIFDKKKIKTLILGDYQLQFGQSLILGAGFNFGKGAETITTAKRNNIGARPYTSVLEVGYFRGGVITYSLTKNIETTLFYSNRKRDGNISNVELANEQELAVSSLILSGLHRTQSEIENKNVLTEENTGANLSFNSNKKDLHIGMTSYFTNYSRAIEKELLGYSLFDFTGKNHLLGSIDASWNINNFYLFGEIASSANSSSGATVGALASISPQVDVSVLYRNFDKNFYNPYSRAFSENYKAINEEGIYWGIKIKPNRIWTLAAYYDFFRFPWLKFRVDAPSDGNESLVRLTWQPSKIITFYAQSRWLNKQRNIRNPDAYFDLPTYYQKHNYLLDMTYKANEYITMRSRFQASSFYQNFSYSQGFYIMQELTLKVRRISISTRYALFDSDDYDNRSYVYEKDVLYAFSIPMLYGVGSRYYLLFSCNISKNIDLWFKFANTQYRNSENNGSGLELIKGNNQTDIKFQIRFKI
ncbi:MAG: helix-hairpin-helix domain-containing protein [Cytophagales bacterium]|nr:MAG: helix-hairpin-helix domain-containing protein [Cytophagales bacterium]